MGLGDYWFSEKELEDFAEGAQTMISVLRVMDKEQIEYDVSDVVPFLARYVECTCKTTTQPSTKDHFIKADTQV